MWRLFDRSLIDTTLEIKNNYEVHARILIIMDNPSEIGVARALPYSIFTCTSTLVSKIVRSIELSCLRLLTTKEEIPRRRHRAARREADRAAVVTDPLPSIPRTRGA